ncbi:tetratricopeptide repeat protein [Streptococcus catagoni]|uniref:tetratricopeptide repeat protein n=1 Tax=Streptococcus catagoni TaxID=2654874 RepID=UPI00140D204E|nr:tetratricopeptide repeat protein [Streptococcus catagoni]
MLNSEKMIASLDQQNLKNAEKYFERALKNDDSETLLSLAEYLESIGFLPHAKKIYLQLNKDYPEVNINLAQILAEDNLIEEAFSYLDLIEKDSPYYVNALLVMADLYDMEGLSDVAREKLLEASKINPDPLILFGLAEINLDLDHFKEAIDYYAQLDNREILNLTGISTYQRIARAYAAMGKFEAAIEFLEKAVSIEYDDASVYELATLLYDQGEFQKANLYFKQLETMNPDFNGFEFIYAQSLHEEHKTEEALRLIQQAIRKNEFDTELLLLASHYAYELHDSESAENFLLKAREVGMDENDLKLPLSTLYLNMERFEDLIALDSPDLENSLTKWNIAKAYRCLDMEEKALASYQELEDDLNANPEFLQEYAYILREFAMLEKAKLMTQKYLSLVPDDLSMQELLDFLS